MQCIVDSHAWIEYFEGSVKGKKTEKIIENPGITLITLESTIAEVFRWCNEKESNFGEVFNDIRRMSDIVPISLTNWIVAAPIKIAKRRFMKDFGLMDALLLAKQAELKAKIITGDKHFKNLKNVVYIGD